jgi:hypothetical protein
VGWQWVTLEDHRHASFAGRGFYHPYQLGRVAEFLQWWEEHEQVALAGLDGQGSRRRVFNRGD